MHCKTPPDCRRLLADFVCRRVGPALPGERASAQIPRDLDAVYRAFDVIEKEQDAPTWDFVWTGLLDESREHNILTHPFLVDVQGSPPVENPSSDMGSIAEAAIKVRKYT